MKFTLQTFYDAEEDKYINRLSHDGIEFFELVCTGDKKKAIQERNGLCLIIDALEVSNREGWQKQHVGEFVVEQNIGEYN